MRGFSRFILVGMLVVSMTVDCTAMGRLFRRGSQSCVCRPVCAEICADQHCPEMDFAASCTGTMSTAAACSDCQNCQGATQHEIVVGSPCHESFAAPVPVISSELLEQPSPIEQPRLTPAVPDRPVDQPAESLIDMPTVLPAPVAAPSTTKVPTPAVPTPELVGDRYSSDATDNTVDPPASVDPPAKAVPAVEEDSANDIFDEPVVPTTEEEPSTEIVPPEPEAAETPPEEPATDDSTSENSEPETPSPESKFDEDDLFGPVDEEFKNKEKQVPDSKKQEEELEEPFDLFGEQLFETEQKVTALTQPGGFQSRQDRTWTDNTATFRCQAKLVHVTAKGVILRRASGSKLVVPLTRLADQDLLFVQQQVSALRVVRARDAAAAKIAVAWGK